MTWHGHPILHSRAAKKGWKKRKKPVKVRWKGKVKLTKRKSRHSWKRSSWIIAKEKVFFLNFPLYDRSYYFYKNFSDYPRILLQTLFYKIKYIQQKKDS